MASQSAFGCLRIVAARLACFFVETNHEVVGNLFGVGSECCTMFVREKVDHGGTGKGFVEYCRKVIVPIARDKAHGGHARTHFQAIVRCWVVCTNGAKQTRNDHDAAQGASALRGGERREIEVIPDHTRVALERGQGWRAFETRIGRTSPRKVHAFHAKKFFVAAF